MNEIVKYDNYLNKLYFKGFKAVEFDLFMTLCSKLKNEGTSNIVLSFSELKRISGDTKHSNKDFVDSLKNMNEKLMKVTCSLELDDKIIMFVLFPTFEIDLKKQVLIVAVNEKFQFILNELVKNFTRFDLTEFVQLDSKYSKTLYRLLKQFKYTGTYRIALNELREKMDCPIGHANKQFIQKILNPAIDELREKKCFESLMCSIQYAHTRGNPVEGFIFSFSPEERNKIEKKEEKKSEIKEKKISNNRFNNIPSRDYDYNELEKQLLS